MSTHPLRRSGATALALTAALALAACEADDDTMSAAACDAYAEAQAAFFGDPAALAGAFSAFADAAPAPIADDASAFADAAARASDDPTALEDPEIVAAGERVGDAVFVGCDAVAALDVDGVDYAFGQLPAELEAGRVAIRFTNESETDQPHELVIVTGADGQTADELRDLPVEELFAQARPVAVAFSDTPGTSGTTLVDLEPGSYLVICTLPVAEHSADHGAEPGDPIHADHGMVATLTVA